MAQYQWRVGVFVSHEKEKKSIVEEINGTLLFTIKQRDLFLHTELLQLEFFVLN